jgi:radical SAM superfamily enzyme YgiQ (UPF0313 family)
MGLGFLAAYAKKHVPDVEFSFYQGSFDSDSEILSGCQGAQIVCFSCTSPSFKHAVFLGTKLRKMNPGIHLVVGGYHASALPEDSSTFPFDQVVVGEGEQPLVDILRGDRRRILYGRQMQFEELPWPDRAIIRNERNIRVAYNDNKFRITSFQGHRGCPYRCRFCCDGELKILVPKGNPAKVRQRPTIDLLDEIEFVTKTYSIDFFKFCDATWNTNLLWVKDFCVEKIRRGSTLPFFANIHAAVTDQEMFDLMRASGAEQIGLGIESGSDRILDSMGKGITKDAVRRTVAAAHKAGLFVRGYFMIGMPEEDNSDLQQTEKFAEELRLDEYGFTILCPYPGTAYYLEEREWLRVIDWSYTDEYRNGFWHTKYLTNRELLLWQERLSKRFVGRLTWHQDKALSGG